MKLALIGLMIGMLLLTACDLTGSTVADECSDLDNDFLKDDCYLENLKCSKIKSVIVRDSCVAELAKTKEDLAVCDLIVTDKTAAYCQEQIAEITNNHDLCNEIDDVYWSNNCHYNLAVENDKDVYCSLITSEDRKVDCFEEIALATNNQLLCEFLPTNKQDGCIMRIALNKMDINVCQEVNVPLNREVCKLRIAKKSNNEKMCDQISISVVKSSCKEYFAEINEAISPN